MVSVIMITYGHENYIREAIKGVLMQETNFIVELIISDDNSPDNTKEIIESFSNHPNYSWIKYFRHSHNKGMMPNFIWTYQQTKGQYIAMCEGDDYWTDPYKLQKQIDFLEANPEYSFCFHKVLEVDINNNSSQKEILASPDSEKSYLIEDLAKKNFIHTPSVVFRKMLHKLPDWLEISPIGDYPLYMLNASYGKIKYFPQIMANYRVGSGEWSSKSHLYRVINIIHTINLLINHFKENDNVIKILKNQRDLLFSNLEKKYYFDLKDISRKLNLSSILKVALHKISDKFSF